jgi:hypothetical protein
VDLVSCLWCLSRSFLDSTQKIHFRKSLWFRDMGFSTPHNHFLSVWGRWHLTGHQNYPWGLPGPPGIMPSRVPQITEINTTSRQMLIPRLTCHHFILETASLWPGWAEPCHIPFVIGDSLNIFKITLFLYSD